MTMGTCSNQDGYFSLGVSGVLPLRVSFIGYESKEVWVPRGSVQPNGCVEVRGFLPG